MMRKEFRWDPRKAALNLRKHRVSFDEASEVFGDAFAVLAEDEAHPDEEERWIILGISYKERLLYVVFSEDETTIRLISARRATKHEINEYEERQSR
jgi:uncharacterized DUF497 family protein